MTPADKQTWKNAATTFLTTQRDVILENESQPEHDELRTELYKEHQPSTITERILVDDLVRNEWLVRRADKVEKDHFQNKPEDTKSLINISLYRTRARNAFKAALRLLDARRGNALKEAKTEIEMLKAAQKVNPDMDTHLAGKLLPILDRLAEKSIPTRASAFLQKLTSGPVEIPDAIVLAVREKILQY